MKNNLTQQNLIDIFKVYFNELLHIYPSKIGYQNVKIEDFKIDEEIADQFLNKNKYIRKIDLFDEDLIVKIKYALNNLNLEIIHEKLDIKNQEDIKNQKYRYLLEDGKKDFALLLKELVFNEIKSDIKLKNVVNILESSFYIYGCNHNFMLERGLGTGLKKIKKDKNNVFSFVHECMKKNPPYIKSGNYMNSGLANFYLNSFIDIFGDFENKNKLENIEIKEILEFVKNINTNIIDNKNQLNINLQKKIIPIIANLDKNNLRNYFKDNPELNLEIAKYLKEDKNKNLIKKSQVFMFDCDLSIENVINVCNCNSKKANSIIEESLLILKNLDFNGITIKLDEKNQKCYFWTEEKSINNYLEENLDKIIKKVLLQEKDVVTKYVELNKFVDISIKNYKLINKINENEINSTKKNKI